MGGVALPLDIVDNFIILTVSVVFVIIFIYISDISKFKKKSCNYWLLVKMIILHCCVGYDM